MDLFGSEYGWSKGDILDQMGFDEALQLQERIKQRTYAGYKMQLAISQNPHSKEPDVLWKMLDEHMTQLTTAAEINIENTDLDTEGLMNLKKIMSGGTAFVIK